jgi:hypothetical protein
MVGRKPDFAKAASRPGYLAFDDATQGRPWPCLRLPGDLFRCALGRQLIAKIDEFQTANRREYPRIKTSGLRNGWETNHSHKFASIRGLI